MHYAFKSPHFFSASFSAIFTAFYRVYSVRFDVLTFLLHILPHISIRQQLYPFHYRGPRLMISSK